eukprot:1158022-Pelagomonas_calceolata.AAC.9
MESLGHKRAVSKWEHKCKEWSRWITGGQLSKLYTVRETQKNEMDIKERKCQNNRKVEAGGSTCKQEHV